MSARSDQPDPVTAADPGVPPSKSRTPLGRAWDRFMSDPASSRNAILVIITAQLAIVLLGGIVIWLVDPAEFDELTKAFWYILQTVTTVGYGDVTPTEPAGRAVGAVVMLLAIASLSILTAIITSAFIEARQVARRAREGTEEAAHWARLEARLDDVVERLDRLQRADGTPREEEAGDPTS
jgi:voltage-gated potassium channel